MKKTIIKLLLRTGYILTYIYPYRISNLIKDYMTFIYTGYNKRYFKHFGNNSIIKPTAILFCGLNYIEVGSNVRIGKDVQLTAWDSNNGVSFNPHIIIGDGTQIGSGAHITAINSIVIGKNVLTGKNVTITDNAHGGTEIEDLSKSPMIRVVESKGPVEIEDNVWIGDKATILANVRIGKGSIIGANAVVTKDVPEYTIVGGNPAKIIRRVI